MAAKGCDQCQVLSINGCATHEIGCPNGHINPATGKGWKEECPLCCRNFHVKYTGQKHCERPGCESYNCDIH